MRPWTKARFSSSNCDCWRDTTCTLLHNTAAYIHLVTEAAKLAFADSGGLLRDPDSCVSPFRNYFSEPYTSARRTLIDSNRAPSHCARVIPSTPNHSGPDRSPGRSEMAARHGACRRCGSPAQP